MKRVLALALAMVMALSLAATGDSGSSGGNVVRIGVFEPATGDSGPGGKQEMLGMQYANKETPTVDIGGTTYNVELVYADNGSTTDKAPTAAAELVSKDVSLVLGSYGSSVAMAGGPVFDEAGHRRHLHQPQYHRRQRLLLPDLLPGQLPGPGAGEFRKRQVQRTEGLLPG